jgi:hypothetical protein
VLRDNGAIHTTAMGAMEALICLPPVDLVVQGNKISCTSTLESGMLVLPSPQSRAQRNIDAASEIVSSI